MITLRRLLPPLLTPLAAFAGIGGAKADLGPIWCVGDSITQSNADGARDDSPRKQLYELLKMNGYAFTFTGDHTTPNDDGMKPFGEDYLFHSGYSGSVVKGPAKGRMDMSADLAKQWNSGRLKKDKPAIALIMLGTNDANILKKTETYAADLGDYVRAIVKLSGDRKIAFVIATIPPNRSTPAREALTLAYNKALPGVVEKLKSEGVNIRLVDTFGPISDNYKKAMQSDHMHPNPQGNALIAKAWLTAIRSL